MIDLPPIESHAVLVEIDNIVTVMSIEEMQFSNEFHMLKFPDWMYALIQGQARSDNESFDDFVRTACCNELIARMQRDAEK